MQWVWSLVQAVGLVVLGPLVTGIVQKLKARLQSRQGASIVQPYRDLAKLFRKSSVRADNASSVFAAVPILVLAATFTAATLAPVVLVPAARGAMGGWTLGDAILLLGLLALGRFLTALGALDAGGAFGGMGASREMTVATLVEPVLMLVVFSSTIALGTTDLGAIATRRSGATLHAADMLALFAMLVLLLAESGRIPVDNPDTHLELTMLHEGMLLEHSGRGLGCLVLATHTKQLVVMTVAQVLFLPGMTHDPGWSRLALALGVFVLETLVLALFLALIESSYAKLRFFRLPQFLGAGFLSAFLAVALRLLQ